MKNILFPILVLFISAQTIAQSKVGTIDSDFILSKMPELTKVQEDLKAYNTKLEADLKVKVDEYQAKVKAYQDGVAAMTEPMKKTKQEEIINLENDIAKFRQNGSQLVQLEQNKLLQPLYTKIGKVLEEVAKAEGYTQVLTITSSGLAYVDPKFDLTKTVMTKLGIPVQ
ncbi:periplasmic chaperone for outer membrane proteins Skp [Aquimarina amphilecti]|uniref:Periplasmic chaperone for outer membrane proteins Skp n=1 Tax=Aquimarina amphilecti TaxID=1038014 RepID=A0A1H7TGA1_AQUAM|nr:OmpH family outer membrane protein [Aquimarina amphilecti]SEL83922.1 periplasmic chaperone for outer membrane proteins Skp [Aquimarina amphilecti]